ncbi:MULTISPECIES: hypothetical protein [Moraxella]|uniref:hypothetical protein n=1 Tax=Moraxella TaxID=475 RepID=UPI0012E8AFE5|nr:MULTISPECIES: hypothetical protein [Moraxella]MBE9579561.1 hypothetical protein [Moraxella sp. K1664]MBE9589094.1 hypothetical protein [Moraxella sp. K1630]MDH9219847.1 hypothetical protein [Moraxella lacunata]
MLHKFHSRLIDGVAGLIFLGDNLVYKKMPKPLALTSTNRHINDIGNTGFCETDKYI